MLETTLTLLLRGEFICAIRHPEAWRWLEDASHRREAEQVLAQLGRRLAYTRQGGAVFAAYREIGKAERGAIREELTTVKNALRLLVNFFVLVMQAQRQEHFLAPGSPIETNRLMAAIDENPSLRNELQTLAGLGKGPAGDGSLRTNLDRLLKRLRDDGYLMLANPEREIYVVTGKIEYLQAVVDFLNDHQGITDDPPEETADDDGGAPQASLL